MNEALTPAAEPRGTMAATLLGLIPPDARLLFHAGCGDGSLAPGYKRANPRAKLVGAETDRHSAAVAASRLDRVYVRDGETYLAELKRQDEQIDCIICGADSVPSVADDPVVSLQPYVASLQPDGLIILCLPNPQYFRRIDDTLRGIAGHLDGSARRSVGRQPLPRHSAHRWLTRLTLHQVDVTSHAPDAAAADAFAQCLAPSLAELGIDAEAFRARVRPSFAILRARAGAAMERIAVVSTMLDPVGGVSDVRVLQPMRALAAHPSIAASVIGNATIKLPEFAGPRIFIFHRPLLAGNRGLIRIRSVLRQGWLVVCEFDDHPDYIPVLQQPDVYNFSGMHAVQTSTPKLGRVLQRDLDEVAVFPNAIDCLPEVKNFRDPNHMTLLFAGINREREWPGCLDALNAVSTRVGSRLHFRIVGDRALYDALNTRNKTFVPLCDYDTYRRLLSCSEISFMPLSDTPFNQCKSDLKFIEAASHRVAALASTTVYSSSVADETTGMLFRSAGELEDRLTRMVLEPSLTRGLGDAARRYILDERMLSSQIASRVTWYRSLWDRREELTDQLFRRVPALQG